ncbi:unnamed protein product [Owenia fusiformis]|uniref:Uncharacterized protein n=1 Tax=Owenia fusiformis TaxID=6347 RepID=A0A8J1YAS7_OWEFU|nr:unnamed protein product [Owenia fusiformis]
MKGGGADGESKTDTKTVKPKETANTTTGSAKVKGSPVSAKQKTPKNTGGVTKANTANKKAEEGKKLNKSLSKDKNTIKDNAKKLKKTNVAKISVAKKKISIAKQGGKSGKGTKMTVTMVNGKQKSSKASKNDNTKKEVKKKQTKKSEPADVKKPTPKPDFSNLIKLLGSKPLTNSSGTILVKPVNNKTIHKTSLQNKIRKGLKIKPLNGPKFKNGKASVSSSKKKVNDGDDGEDSSSYTSVSSMSYDSEDSDSFYTLSPPAKKVKHNKGLENKSSTKNKGAENSTVKTKKTDVNVKTGEKPKTQSQPNVDSPSTSDAKESSSSRRAKKKTQSVEDFIAETLAKLDPKSKSAQKLKSELYHLTQDEMKELKSPSKSKERTTKTSDAKNIRSDLSTEFAKKKVKKIKRVKKNNDLNVSSPKKQKNTAQNSPQKVKKKSGLFKSIATTSAGQQRMKMLSNWNPSKNSSSKIVKPVPQLYASAFAPPSSYKTPPSSPTSLSLMGSAASLRLAGSRSTTPSSRPGTPSPQKAINTILQDLPMQVRQGLPPNVSMIPMIPTSPSAASYRAIIATNQKLLASKAVKRKFDEDEEYDEPSERRLSVRQSESSFKYKDIVVKKCSNYTQIWLFTQTQTKNALNPKVLQEIRTALHNARFDDSKLVLLSGSGSVFCSGVDLPYITQATDRRSAAKQMVDSLRDFISALIAFPKPIVAAVNGPAVGLGVGILPLCDIVLASDKASFYTPYSRLNQTPEACASYTLPQVIGLATANEMLLGGRKLTAIEAYQIGLVSQVFWPTSMMQEVIPRVQNMAMCSAKAMECSKLLIRSHQKAKLEYTNETECNMLLERWSSNECYKAMNTYLLQEQDMLI